MDLSLADLFTRGAEWINLSDAHVPVTAYRSYIKREEAVHRLEFSPEFKRAFTARNLSDPKLLLNNFFSSRYASRLSTLVACAVSATKCSDVVALNEAPVLLDILPLESFFLLRFSNPEKFKAALFTGIDPACYRLEIFDSFDLHLKDKTRRDLPIIFRRFELLAATAGNAARELSECLRGLKYSDEALEIFSRLGMISRLDPKRDKELISGIMESSVEALVTLLERRQAASNDEWCSDRESRFNRNGTLEEAFASPAEKVPEMVAKQGADFTRCAMRGYTVPALAAALPTVWPLHAAYCLESASLAVDHRRILRIAGKAAMRVSEILISNSIAPGKWW